MIKQGDKVTFSGELKCLDKGTVGFIGSITNDSCVIVYPQNIAHESDGKGGWKLIKGKKNQVYAHSVKLTEATPAP